MKVVAILGQMRSGTSLLASIVHHLGYPVAITMGAPIPPKWDFDWEDIPFSEMLMYGPPPTQGWFAEYLRGRYMASKRLGTEGRIAVKSPYLARHWKMFNDSVYGDYGETIILMTQRDQAEIDRSMRAAPQLSQEDQAFIRRALEGITPDLNVTYDDLVEDGEVSVRAIAGLLGVTDEDAIDRAVRQIRPREALSCR